MKREKHIWAFTKRHIVWYSDKATGKGLHFRRQPRLLVAREPGQKYKRMF